MTKVLHDRVRESRIPQMTSPAPDVQFVVEAKCEDLFDFEAFDCSRLAQRTREMTRHRFPLIAKSLQNGWWKRVM
jgi:hypothetical protein